MRILIMTDLYPPHWLGGAELCCQSHVEGLQARGHEVFVLTSRWGIDTRAVEGNVHRLLHYVRPSVGTGPRQAVRGRLRLRRRCDQLRRALSLSRNYNAARAVVATTQPDVAYAWNMQWVSISPILAAQDLGVPAVIRLADHWLAQLRTELCLEPDPLKRWYRAVFSGLGRFGDLDTRHMAPMSLALKQCYIRAGFSADSLQVIPEGVPSDLLLDMDESPVLPLPAENRSIRLLFVGRLVKEKAPDVAIQTLACLVTELGVRRAKLDIIGEGLSEYESHLRSMVANLGLDDQVSFVGKLGHRQVLERYTQYDALLFPSRWVEPFGMGVIEAMARGLPVVATNRGGPAEVIVDGKTGLLVPPDDARAMATAVKRLSFGSELTQTIRCNALAAIRHEYSLEHIIGQVEDYLQLAALH